MPNSWRAGTGGKLVTTLKATRLALLLTAVIIPSFMYIRTDASVVAAEEAAGVRAASICQREDQEACMIPNVCTFVCSDDCGQALNQLPLVQAQIGYPTAPDPCTDDISCAYEVLDKGMGMSCFANK